MNQQIGSNNQAPLIQRNPAQEIGQRMALGQAMRNYATKPQAMIAQQTPPHPLFQGREMAHQMPPTPHSGAVHHLLQHAIPIFHQVNAIKKALGTGGKSVANKNNPGGVQGF